MSALSEIYKNPKELPVRFFSEEVDKHHRSEKNVFPYTLCYRMVIEAIKESFGENAPIIVMSGRRLDLGWDLYKKILPSNRIFIAPMRDAFEDLKARAWEALGEANQARGCKRPSQNIGHYGQRGYTR